MSGFSDRITISLPFRITSSLRLVRYYYRFFVRCVEYETQFFFYLHLMYLHVLFVSFCTSCQSGLVAMGSVPSSISATRHGLLVLHDYLSCSLNLSQRHANRSRTCYYRHKGQDRGLAVHRCEGKYSVFVKRNQPTFEPSNKQEGMRILSFLNLNHYDKYFVDRVQFDNTAGFFIVISGTLLYEFRGVEIFKVICDP